MTAAFVQKPKGTSVSRVTVAGFGEFGDGARASLFQMRNASGVEVSITDLGASIASLKIPDRHGVFGDIVLGYDTVADYFADGEHMGAVAGRFAGRIAEGKFELDGETYQLARNARPNHLHGGNKGFNKRLWQAEILETDSGAGVTFSLISPDGDEGYPGELSVSVTYMLSDSDELIIEYVAHTDVATIINLTQHSYFNLSGVPDSRIDDHYLEIAADDYLPVDAGMIPTGELRSVADTPMDFRIPKPIGRDIDTPDPQLDIGGGYDHTWVLAEKHRQQPAFAASVIDPGSGRMMTVLTDQPALQLYTANSLDDSMPGKGGVAYGARQGFCLETQNFPDAPNHNHFPSAVLRPDGEYRSRTILRFGTRK